MKRYIKTRKTKHLNDFLDSAFTEKDDFAHRFLSEVFTHFEMDFSPVPLIKRDEAAKIQTPISIVAAGQDIIFPGAKMIKRAKKIFPSLKHTLLLDDSKQVQNSQDNFRIAELILNSVR